MVNRPSADLHYAELPIEDVNWSSVPLSGVVSAGKRLEAAVFGIEGKHARDVVMNCKWGSVPLYGDKGISTAYTLGRFKRNWLEYSDLPIYQPSSITDINPTPDGFLSHTTKTNIDALRVKKGQILITCSGTIGKTSLVSDTLDGKIFSHDLIRLETKSSDDTGYVYAFLNSKTGNSLLQTNNYGAVIKHIEPEHLSEIPIPNPPSVIKQKINDLVLGSFELRDSSNKKIDIATKFLAKELNLLPNNNAIIESDFEVNNYNVKLSNLFGRLDGSYHIPVTTAIVEHLHRHSKEVLTVGDKKVTSDIILAGIFKRVYVGGGHGIPFLGGKEISQLVPKTEKFLSRPHHSARYKKELRVSENMILVTNRGSVGVTSFVPRHWDGCAVSQNVLKLIPASNEIAGYLFIFLQSEWGKTLIQRQTYGSVVDMIDDAKMADVEFPLLKNQQVQKEINTLALEANKMRNEAYLREQEAMKILNDEVLFASK